MAGYGAAGIGPASGSMRADAMLVIGCRLNEATSLGYDVPAAGTALGPCRHRARSRPRACRRPTIAVAADARPFLQAADERLLGAGRPRRRARSRRRDAANAEDRAAWEAATIVDAHALGRPGRPSRAASSRRCAGSCPTTRS